MNTAAAQLLLMDFPTRRAILPDGRTQLLGCSDKLYFEIVPEEAVRCFVPEWSEKIHDIVELYVGDRAKAGAVLQRAEKYVSEHPNMRFAEFIEGGLIFACVQLKIGEAETIYLSITEPRERALPEFEVFGPGVQEGEP